MKEQTQLILTSAGNSLLMFFAVLCTFGALISAFSFPISLWIATIFWIPACVILAVMAMRYRYKGVLIALIPIAIMFIVFFGEIVEGARWLIFYLTDYYSNWLVITVRFPESAYFDGNPTIFFVAVGIVIATLLSISICIQRSTFLTALFTIPIVMLTFVVVANNHPNFIFIFGLLVVLISILITNALVFDDFRKRGVMTAPALAVAILFLGIAYFINPPERFDRAAHTAVVNRHFSAIAATIGNFWELVPNPGMGIGWPVAGGYGRGNMWVFNTRYVNIAESGTMTLVDRELLEVEVSAPGTFYLRGYSMQYFDGRSWSINSNTDPQNYERDEVLRSFPAQIAMLHAETWGTPSQLVGMNISRVGDITNVTYKPYYIMSESGFLTSAGAALDRFDVTFFHVQQSIHRLFEELTTQNPWVGDDSFMYIQENIIINELIEISNAISETHNSTDGYAGVRLPVRYDFVMNFTAPQSPLTIGYSANMAYRIADFIYLPGYAQNIINYGVIDAEAINRGRVALPILDLEPYLQINEEVAVALRAMAHAAGIFENAPRAHIADAVARYIRSSASYSLSPGIVPEGEDFVLYFLQYMESGFCIHFATAATLMLRSLGVPARFTTGYVFSVPSGYENQPIMLTDRNAHAWVEVFYEDIGWLYIEVTPGGVGAGAWYSSPESEELSDMLSQSAGGAMDSYLMGDFFDIPEFDDGSTHVTPNGWDGGAQSAVDTADERTPQWQVNLIVIAVFSVIIPIAILIRRRLILNNRKKNFNQSDSNAAVISMWQYIEKVARREAVPPTDIEELALKARFSKHKLTQEERAKVKTYTKRLVSEIYRSKESYVRLWLKYARVVN